MVESEVDGDLGRPGEEAEQPVVPYPGHVQHGGQGPGLALGSARRGGGDDVQDEGRAVAGRGASGMGRHAHRGRLASRSSRYSASTARAAPRTSNSALRARDASARRDRSARVPGQARHRLRQQVGAPRGHEEAFDAVGDHVGHSAHGGGDHRQPRAHRLHERHGQALLVRGQHEQVRPRHQPGGVGAGARGNAAARRARPPRPPAPGRPGAGPAPPRRSGPGRPPRRPGGPPRGARRSPSRCAGWRRSEPAPRRRPRRARRARRAAVPCAARGGRRTGRDPRRAPPHGPAGAGPGAGRRAPPSTPR